jgi:hypothetical protein
MTDDDEVLAFPCDCSCACGVGVADEGEICGLCATGRCADDLADDEP